MNKEFKKSIILVSGGMDSCVTSAIAKNESEEIAFLHANYGQRTEKRELQAFHEIADFYSVEEKLIFDFTHLSKIGGSSLTDFDIEVTTADLNNTEIPSSYVPFRNANILSAAVSWAEVLNANAIYIGAVEEDSSGYPDCRRSFYDAFENIIQEGTKPETNIKIVTPLINMSKKEIIENGFQLNAPLQRSWSCYKSNEVPCEQCDSCALRARGFKLAGKTDPILTLS